MVTSRSSRRPSHRPRRDAADIFTAIADPSRRRLLDLLSVGEQPVNELAEAFRISRPAVSQHLRVLRDVGAVEERRVGRQRRYRLRPSALREVAAWIARYERFWDDRLAALGRRLDEED
jgi:DNA-binding transcriptional ArsR family regulator